MIVPAPVAPSRAFIVNAVRAGATTEDAEKETQSRTCETAAAAATDAVAWLPAAGLLTTTPRDPFSCNCAPMEFRPVKVVETGIEFTPAERWRFHCVAPS